jgi:monovalent cation:H+ antiporter-2, CPA2 family
VAAGTDVAAVLTELGAVAVGLAVLARVGLRTGVSPIPFYLLAGVVLSAAGPIHLSEQLVEVGSEIGVVLLLVMLGLEYTGEELASNLRTGLRGGALDLVLNFTPGFALGLILGWSIEAAVLLGGVAWISSSGVVAKVLADLDRLGNRETPAILSVLVMEDLAMAVYLPLVGALLVGGGALAAFGSLAAALAAAGVALVVAVRYGERLSDVISHHSDEVLLLTTFGLVLLIGGLAERLQLSAAIGAFLVGIALSGQVAERTRSLLSPLRDLFAAAFFLFFGLSVDAASIPGQLPLAIGLAVVTTATKLVTGWYAAGRVGAGARGRMRAGTALVARGEFSIVIAGLGVGAAVEPHLAPLAADYVLLLAITGPLLTRWSDALLAAARALTGRPRARAVPAAARPDAPR